MFEEMYMDEESWQETIPPISLYFDDAGCEVVLSAAHKTDSREHVSLINSFFRQIYQDNCEMESFMLKILWSPCISNFCKMACYAIVILQSVFNRSY